MRAIRATGRPRSLPGLLLSLVLLFCALGAEAQEHTAVGVIGGPARYDLSGVGRTPSVSFRAVSTMDRPVLLEGAVTYVSYSNQGQDQVRHLLPEAQSRWQWVRPGLRPHGGAEPGASRGWGGEAFPTGLSTSVASGLGLPVTRLGTGPFDAASTQEGGLRLGDRVRYSLSCDTVGVMPPHHEAGCGREGTVVRLTPDSLEVLARPTRETFALASLRALEVRRVEGPGWAIPTAAGAVLGGAGTYAWLHAGGSTSRCDRSGNQDAMGRGECAALTVAGGVAGAGLGALASRLLRTERWVPLPVGRLDVSVGWQR